MLKQKKEISFKTNHPRGNPLLRWKLVENIGVGCSINALCFVRRKSLHYFWKEMCMFFVVGARRLRAEDTHRGKRRRAGGGRSPAESRWGTGAGGRSWKRSARSRPDWSGISPAGRSTDAGTWEEKRVGGEKPSIGRKRATKLHTVHPPIYTFKAGYFWATVNFPVFIWPKVTSTWGGEETTQLQTCSEWKKSPFLLPVNSKLWRGFRCDIPSVIAEKYHDARRPQPCRTCETITRMCSC